MEKDLTELGMRWRKIGHVIKVIGTELGWGLACAKYFKTPWFLVDGRLALQLCLTLYMMKEARRYCEQLCL